MDPFIESLYRRLQIDDFHFVEIESKKRILPTQVKDLRKYLAKKKKVKHEKTTTFFDQFLDTPQMDLFKKGASLRLRYKRNGTKVVLQYKGPGFLEEGLLYRSEFSSKPLAHLIREESHHDMIHFSDTTIREVLDVYARGSMTRAMKRHLGAGTVSRISYGPIISSYQKDKYSVDLGSAFLEPSLDRIYAFHINKTGLHPLSMFWEFENEVKAEGHSLKAKLEHIPDLLEFDEKLAEEFDLKVEPLHKYHRCTSIFLPEKFS